MKNLFLILLTFSLLKATCQDTITTRVIIFDEDNMSDFTSESNEPYKKNAIKFNPLLILNGEIPIYYERALTNNISIEAAIGMTFKDYMGSVSGFLDDDSDNFYSDSKSEKIKSHISFKLGARYYTGGVALDGFYFAFEYANRKYGNEITLTSIHHDPVSGNSTELTNTYNTEKAYNEFKIIAGSQAHNYWDNFFIDYYFGVGMRMQNNKELISENDINNNYVYSINTETKTTPSFYAGLKFGFEF